MADGDNGLGTLIDTGATIVESPETSIETPEIESQQPTGDEQIQPREEGDQPDKPRTDARLLPKDVQRALKAMRDDPTTSNVARALNDSYFREQAYAKEGTLEEIRGIKSTIEGLGGTDGIAELQARAELLEKMDAQMAEGRPEVLDDIPPEGFKRLVAPAIERLERLDPQSYNDTLRPHLVKSIAASGLPDSLNMLQYLLSRGDVPEATKQAKAIQDWISDLRNQASTRAQNDPRASDIERREQALRTSETNQFKQGIAREAISQMNSQIEKQITSLFKGSNLSDGQKKDFAAGVYAGIEDALRQDKTYLDNVKAAIDKRDDRRLKSYIASKLPDLASRVARELRNTRYPSLTQQPAKRPAQQQSNTRSAETPTNGKPLMLPSRPADKDIDNSKTNMTMLIAHKAYLKSGKYVSWK